MPSMGGQGGKSRVTIQYIIAFGSNVGDRVSNIRKSLSSLHECGVHLLRLSGLYETEPVGGVDQGRFLNAAGVFRSEIPPIDLLSRIKTIERSLGRDTGPAALRWGPRPIDLDIIFASSGSTDAIAPNGMHLKVPHPLWSERDFVLAPLSDLEYETPGLATETPSATPDASDAALADFLSGASRVWRRRVLAWRRQVAAGIEADLDSHLLRNAQAVRSSPALASRGLSSVVPVKAGPGGVADMTARPHVMGILNMTPDSFSDGGANSGVADAVAAARRMVAEGASIIDVGGQSTRPGAAALSAEEEEARVVPVVRAMRQCRELDQTPISVDTFHAKVASSAVQAGADIVNDISGGAFDPELLPTVAGLGVPYVAMHVRGDLATMHAPSSSVSSTGAVATVASELAATARRALAAGVEPWSMILDPGVGFSKALAGNLQLLTSADDIRASMPGPLRRAPVLVGHSRKRFLGHITGKEAATDRDVASAAGCALAVQHGADIVRVHRVGTCLDGVLMGAAAAGFSRVFGEDSAFQRGLPR